MNQDASLGLGYCSFQGKFRQNILNIKSPEIHNAGIEVIVKVCTEASEVRRALGIKASVGVDLVWAGIDVRSEFASNSTKGCNSVTVLVAATRVIGQKRINRAEFVSTFKDATDLYRQGGDRYVSTIKEGGQYVAAYRFQAESREHRNKIEAEAKAQFPVFSAGFNASFGNKIEKFKESYKIRYDFMQQGWGFQKAELPEQSKIADWVQSFGSVDLDAPMVLGFGTDSYAQISGAPNLKQIEDYFRNYTEPRANGHSIRDTEFQAQWSLNSLLEVRKVYQFYQKEFLADEVLKQSEGWLRGVIKQIRDWKDLIDQNPTQPNFTINDPDLEHLKYPVAHYRLLNAEVPKKSSDPSFYDLDSDMILRMVYPVSISTESGAYITQISTVYKYHDKSKYTFSREHGGKGGTLSDSHEFTPEAPIKSLSDWKVTTKHPSTAVESFTMNAGDTSYRFGKPGTGTLISMAFDEKGYAFVGWSGNGKDYLAALIPTYCKFEAPFWKEPSWDVPSWD